LLQSFWQEILCHLKFFSSNALHTFLIYGQQFGLSSRSRYEYILNRAYIKTSIAVVKNSSFL
jgi:hypothetical protein